MRPTPNFIDGRYVLPDSTAPTVEVVDPATEDVIGYVRVSTPDDVDRAVGAARGAFAGWSSRTPDERSAYLVRIAEEVARRADALVDVITGELGAPLAFCRSDQVMSVVDCFERAARFGAEYDYRHAIGRAALIREPYGVVAAITPWNYPLYQLALKAAFAIAAGNCVVVKPSEMTPLNAELFADALVAAGLPNGVINIVHGTGPVTGAAIVGHSGVDIVSFTGSTAVGKQIAARAAQSVTPVSLELGGKSPNVLLPDADLSRALPHAVSAAMVNSGQACSALTRLLVPPGLRDEVEQRLEALVGAIRVGDPRAAGTQIGPLVSSVQRDRVFAHVQRGIEDGARPVIGGTGAPTGLERGYYARPTVLSDVTVGMSVHRDEIFGPVLVVEEYRDDTEAVEIANDSVYGLAGSVWSDDLDHAHAIAERLRVGHVQINGSGYELDAPFGGYKQSGLGREGGVFGLEEFLEIKTMTSPPRKAE